jgi:hypothetical protein
MQFRFTGTREIRGPLPFEFVQQVGKVASVLATAPQKDADMPGRTLTKFLYRIFIHNKYNRKLYFEPHEHITAETRENETRVVASYKH